MAGWLGEASLLVEDLKEPARRCKRRRRRRFCSKHSFGVAAARVLFGSKKAITLIAFEELPCHLTGRGFGDLQLASFRKT